MFFVCVCVCICSFSNLKCGLSYTNYPLRFQIEHRAQSVQHDIEIHEITLEFSTFIIVHPRAQKHKNTNYHFLIQYFEIWMCLSVMCHVPCTTHTTNEPDLHFKLYMTYRIDHYCMVTSRINELLNNNEIKTIMPSNGTVHTHQLNWKLWNWYWNLNV